jgi:hypothetical protein
MIYVETRDVRRSPRHEGDHTMPVGNHRRPATPPAHDRSPTAHQRCHTTANSGKPLIDDALSNRLDNRLLRWCLPG